MLKLVYPCASKTFKVLRYCLVSMYRLKLLSNVTQCILLTNKVYLKVSEITSNSLTPIGLNY